MLPKRIQRALAAWWWPSSSSQSSPSRLTRWMVYVIVGGLAAGHLYDVAAGVEHWPFSNYPMWAKPGTDWRASDVRVCGVDATTGAEVELEPEQFGPLPRLQLHRALQPGRADARRSGHADAAALARDRLAGLLELYESRRTAHQHDGPALSAIRVYRVEFDVHPADADRTSPDALSVVAEASSSAPPGAAGTVVATGPTHGL